MSSPERHRTLRHQYSTDNMNAIPPFNIPNLRIDQRKTSSAEDMARKNSGGKGKLNKLSIIKCGCGCMCGGIKL